MLETPNLRIALEAILMAAGKPMTEEQLLELFREEERPSMGVMRQSLRELQQDYEDRGIELIKVASGYRFQIKQEWVPWVGKLFEEKAQKYSRALLETLALIAYRQPITRGEIESIRGVTVSTSILKTLQDDREWIRMVGHKEVPGRPALYATTKGFLDYFGLESLQNLPPLPEIMDLDTLNLNLDVPILEMKEEHALDDPEDSEVTLEGAEHEVSVDLAVSLAEADDISDLEISENIEEEDELEFEDDEANETELEAEEEIEEFNEKT